MSISPHLLTRALLFGALLISEALLISVFFGVPMTVPEWSNPAVYAKLAAQLGILTVVAFVIIAYPHRDKYLAAWETAIARHDLLFSLWVNLGVFAVLLAATIAYSATAEAAGEPPLGLFAAYCCLLVGGAVSLALIVAPSAFWTWMVRDSAGYIATALLAGLMVIILSELSQESWVSLSSATLVVSHAILALYETGTMVDFDQKLLGAGGFTVSISAACSGYEGVGLVVAFMAFYLWAFRQDLRFPNALLLVPLGAVAIWMLNGVRIAVLVSIGAHVSPSIAVEGFHSQAGWIAFLLVTLGLIVVSRGIPFFMTPPSSHKVRAADIHDDRRSDDTTMLAYLAPFMALMATTILAAAFAPHDQWLYAVKVAAVSLVIWNFRHVYARLSVSVSWTAIGAGLVVGAGWIATDPAAGGSARLGEWLQSLPIYLAVIWIALRAFGSIILIPIAEELAFRGYLHRALIARRFESVDFGRFSWIAFIVSSVLFGLMHERWLAGILAGAVFALVMYRSNRLSDPIAAHMTANAVIMIWAVVMQQWSLL